MNFLSPAGESGEIARFAFGRRLPAAETALERGPRSSPMALGPFGDPVFVGLVAALVVFFFFIYLLLRRTVTGFMEGFEESRR